MPISQFPEWLRKAIAFLPGTYGMSLLREHSMMGALSEMGKNGLPSEAIEALRDTIDANIYFFDTKVEQWQEYLILIAVVIALISIYVVLNLTKTSRKQK